MLLVESCPPVSGPAALTVLEQLVRAKVEEPGEDLVVVTPDLAAVVDGVTTKHGRLWGHDGDLVQSGRWAALVVGSALVELQPDWEAERVVAHLTQRLDEGVQRQHRGLPRAERPAASLVLVRPARRELLAVGDCQWRVDGVPGRVIKRVDALVADLRAAAWQALGLGDGGQLPDPSREVVLPFLRVQGGLANTVGEFGFGQLDGTPVPPQHVHVRSLPAGAHVVLASDGYPELHDSLEESERELHRRLEQDPHCVGVLRGTKGRLPGAASFDDRAYLRLRLGLQDGDD